MLMGNDSPTRHGSQARRIMRPAICSITYSPSFFLSFFLSFFYYTHETHADRDQEYIAYDIAQVKLRYLLRVEMTQSRFGY